MAVIHRVMKQLIDRGVTSEANYNYLNTGANDLGTFSKLSALQRLDI